MLSCHSHSVDLSYFLICRCWPVPVSRLSMCVRCQTLFRTLCFYSEGHDGRLTDSTTCSICSLIQVASFLWLLWWDALGPGETGFEVWRLVQHRKYCLLQVLFRCFYLQHTPLPCSSLLPSSPPCLSSPFLPSLPLTSFPCSPPSLSFSPLISPSSFHMAIWCMWRLLLLHLYFRLWPWFPQALRLQDTKQLLSWEVTSPLYHAE